MKDPAGGKAPAGGFKDLGWYGGYQYYGGSFAPKAGMIHPNSPQQGSGQMVSAEVNRQSSVAAGKDPNAFQTYVDQQNNKPVSSYSSNGLGNWDAASTTPGAQNGGAGAGIGYTEPAALNLPKLYDNMYSSSGITDLEAELSAKEKGFIDAKAVINDNPWLSEGSRVGREAKLQKLYDERTANLKNDIAVKKADIQTRLDLETKQFDINSQAAQQSLARFNTLLSMGALDNASGEDIANITRATGLSSQAILSAVDNNKKKNINTSIIQYDDGENQGYAVVDQYGNILNRQTIAASKPTKGSGGGADELSKQFETDKKMAPIAAREAATSGKTLGDMMSFYSQWLSNEEIYRIYSNVNYYKATAAQQKADKKRYGIK